MADHKTGDCFFLNGRDISTNGERKTSTFSHPTGNFRTVRVRYFATVTPREEGSVIKWKYAPEKFNGSMLYQALEGEGVELKDHLPQVYEQDILGFSNLDEDVEFHFDPDQTVMNLDVRLTPLRAGTLAYIPITNPGPLGLFSYSLTTMMLMVLECGMVSEAMIAYLLPTAFIYGGVTQLMVGMWEIYPNNLFGTLSSPSAAMTLLVKLQLGGAFWISWALHTMWGANGQVSFAGDKAEKQAAKCAWLCIWGVFTAMLFVQTLWITRGLQVVFALSTVCFFLLAGGVYDESTLLAGGIFGFLTALGAFYVGVAELMNDLQKKQVLPLGHIKKEHQGYGNSAPGAGATLVNDPDQLVSLRARLTKKKEHGNASSEQIISSDFERAGATLVNDPDQLVLLRARLTKKKEHGNASSEQIISSDFERAGATLVNDPDQLVSLRARLTKKKEHGNASSEQIISSDFERL
eukprot:g35149.t1